MKIVFLGTGGGRIVVTNQLRATGGFVIFMDGEMLHIDPGPGALVKAKEYKVRLNKLTGVLVSHKHPDHYTDAPMVIEAMNLGSREKKGVLIGSKGVLEGSGDDYPVISRYHKNIPKRVVVLDAGDETEAGKIRVRGTPIRHGDCDGVGFVLSGTKKVGYTSDTEYFEGLEKYFMDCDYLIINCIRPKENPLKGHMDSGMAKELISKARPKVAILQHFGRMMVFGGARRECEWIERETGIKTVAANDGMIIDSGEDEGKGIKRYLG